jgi:hypothetical protein
MLLLVLLSGTLLFQAILRKRDCLSFFSLNVNLKVGFRSKGSIYVSIVVSLTLS